MTTWVAHSLPATQPQICHFRAPAEGVRGATGLPGASGLPRNPDTPPPKKSARSPWSAAWVPWAHPDRQPLTL